MTINRNDKSTSISTQMDSLIPPSKISNLTQGMFVGAVSDNFNERIEQKIFHAEIVVDNEKVKRETANYKKLPQIIDFRDEDGNDRMQGRNTGKLQPGQARSPADCHGRNGTDKKTTLY